MLTGKALTERAKALHVRGYSKMKAGELRLEISRIEARLAAEQARGRTGETAPVTDDEPTLRVAPKTLKVNKRSQYRIDIERRLARAEERKAARKAVYDAKLAKMTGATKPGVISGILKGAPPKSKVAKKRHGHAGLPVGKANAAPGQLYKVPGRKHRVRRVPDPSHATS